MRWTKNQQMLIESLREKNLLVSAAAGSGKTTVMVERILDLIINDKADLAKMLIVTFTRAAAAEMRQKIQDSLEEHLEKNKDSFTHLREQLDSLNRAQISTIHSFCISIVEENFHLLDIDPTLRTGTDTEINILKEEAVNEVLEKYYKELDEPFIKFVETFSGNRNDLKIVDIILDIYNFSRSKTEPETWLNETKNMYEINPDYFEKNIWLSTIKDKYKIQLEGYLNLLNRAKDLCIKDGGPEEYEETINKDIEGLNNLQFLLMTDFDKFCLSIDKYKFSRLKSIRGGRKELIDKSLMDKVKRLRDDYKKGLRDLKKVLDKNGKKVFIEEIINQFPVINVIIEIVKEMSKIYQNKKIKSGLLDFSDLEHYALQVLENEKIRNIYKNKYDYIFVDEYQDSNLIQEKIINFIKRADNLFLVGDIKQSIYRFRLADPSLFQEKYDSYDLDWDSDSLDKRVDLNKNFRSNKDILNGVNYLFKNLMSRNFGEIDYNQDAYLYSGIDFPESSLPDIDLNILDYNTDEIEDDDLINLSRIEAEAKLIAKRIKLLIGKEIYLPREEKYKKIEYNDIVILLRSPRFKTDSFQKIFSEENIPLYIDDNSGYFDTMEVKVFLNLLRLIDNKRQDIPLLSVMRSVITDFKEEELIDIRIEHKDVSFYDAIENYIDKKNNKLSFKLKNFMNNLNQWADEARYKKIDEFIWNILLETNFYNICGALFAGEKRQANLNLLVERARKYEKNSTKGLFNFIRYIEKLKGSGSDLGTAKIMAENDDVVRLMSIHRSKGLEFPVLFIADLGKKFNLQDLRDDIILHKDLGIGMKYVDLKNRIALPSLAQLAIKERKKLESLSEELRILYVGMTRAINKLILTGSVNNIRKRSERWLKGTQLNNLLSSSNYLDWIGSAIIFHNDAEILRNITGLDEDEININEDKSSWNISINNLNELEIKAITDKSNREEIQERLYYPEKYILEKGKDENVARALNWEYRYSESSEIPSKLSASDIKNEKEGISLLERIIYREQNLSLLPDLNVEKNEFSAAEKGSIMHFAMQHIFPAGKISRENIIKEINKMIEKELLSKEEAKTININKIINFYKGELGQRLLNADIIEREKAFVLKKRAVDIINDLSDTDEEVLIQGIIDCFFIKDNRLVLIDYKTDRVINGDISSIVKRYRKQLALYTEALESLMKKNVNETYLYLFDLDREILIDNY